MRRSTFDIFAAAGAAKTAFDLSYTVTVSTGRLDVTFTKKLDTPKLSAIHVKSLAGGPTPSATPTVTTTFTLPPSTTGTPTRTTTPFVVRVNGGGGDYTDTQGNLWSADYGYVGGFAPAAITNDITNSLDDPLFQTDHRWNASADPGYSFSVPNGQYEVTLRFAEFNQCSANSRKFSVSIEGTAVLSDFDIFAAAGNRCYAFVDRVVAATVSDGVLTIGFTANVSKPKISAIQIKAQGGAVPATATATATTGTLPTNTPTATPTRTATPFVARVNSGGGDYTDTQGHLWSADYGYAGGFVATPVANDITNTLDDPLFQTDHRWTGSANPGYSFAVPNGQYEVTLRFAEFNQCSINSRKFSVSIEGAPVLTDFDIFVAAGNRCYAFVDRVVTTTVSDGVLTISFTANVSKPKISAIQIKQIN